MVLHRQVQDPREYRLIVARRYGVDLIDTEGEVEALDGKVIPFESAFALAGEDAPKHNDIEAINSGRRSTLIRIEGELIKILGCDVREALAQKTPYNRSHLGHPYGGTTERAVRFRFEEDAVLGGIFREQGFHYPFENLGMFRYPQVFVDDVGPINPSPLVAAITSVPGDTRLVELLHQPIKDKKLAKEALKHLCRQAGAQVFHFVNADRTWGLNAHSGNFVLYLDELGEKVHIGMTDFDSNGKREAAAWHQIGFYPREILNLLYKLNNRHRSESEMISLAHFAQSLNMFFGFNAGFQNPDKEHIREGLSFDMLQAAFDLENVSSLRPIT